MYHRQFWLVGSALSALSVFRFPLIIVTIIDNNFISLSIYLEEGEEEGGTVVVSPSDTQSQLQQKSLIFPSKPESVSRFLFRLSSREDWYWESMCGFCDIEALPRTVKLVSKLEATNLEFASCESNISQGGCITTSPGNIILNIQMTYLDIITSWGSCHSGVEETYQLLS